MEYIAPELLTREQMLNALYERKLQISNPELISQETLVRTYKKFLTPLAKRVDNRKRKCSSNYKTTTESVTPMAARQEYRDIMDVEIETQEMPPLDLYYNQRHHEIENIVSVCVKRPFDCNMEEHISSATKRIKINRQ